MSLADLLTAWREATIAAELADRLAAEAASAVEEAGADEAATAELVVLAEAAAAAAERAADNARRCAARARERSNLLRTERLPGAQQAAQDAKSREDLARDRYRESSAHAFPEHPKGD